MKQALSGLFLFLVVFLILIPYLLTRPPRPPAEKLTVHLFLTERGQLRRLELEEYLIGVVAGEMPASFGLEALKAQAVAARTVTVKRMRAFGGRGSSSHPQADLSDDPGESQAWLSRRDMLKKWGFREYLRNRARITEAVKSTAGLVLTYKGELIDAVYHSTSGPRTENAGEIWGKDLPYLQSVTCSFGEHSPKYKGEKAFSYAEFWTKLGMEPASAPPDLRILEYTAGGRVKTLTVNGRKMHGEVFRRLLGLNSSCFSWRLSAGGILFQTTGYGHGVGLCQYGADGLARKGWDFRSILKYYYRGAEIVRLQIRG
ncbi:MAG: stage II sporulation protein D [Firmicutes bacterium]|jgi:stage II sporulation protein D|nr:stage II sporulation protein D [Bacillota bacterium]